MDVVIIGSGAVGGYYGGRLAVAGHRVFFTARGRTLEALRAKGLQATSIDGDFSISAVEAGSRPPDRPADAVIIAVKAYDTAAILDIAAPAVGNATTILSLQNGLENEPLLMERFGSEKVIGGLCYIGAEMTEPGRIRHVADGQVIIGEWMGRSSPRCERIRGAFEKAGIRVKIAESIQTRLWGKLLWNTAFNSACALARADVGVLLDNLYTRRLLEAVMREVDTAAAVHGVTLGEKVIQSTLDHSNRELRAVRPSMLQDLLRGRRIEHEAFTGAVERFGRQHGFPTPVCSSLHALLDVLDRGLSR